jgi:hypothetical protein
MGRPLKWQRVHDAIVVPLSESFDFSSGAGVVASGPGQYVVGTGLRRYSQEIVPPPQITGLSAERSIPRAVFGGFVFAHFGHFLVESLSRLWIEEISTIDSSVPLVWIRGGMGWEFTPWMTEICRRIGLEREIVLVDARTGPLGVEELIIPQAGFELREWMHPMQMKRLGTTPWLPNASDSRVWLSRTRVGESAGLTQEHEVEAVLAERGWSIICPESLSIDEQVETLVGASHVAGVEGSALHGLMLVKDFGGTIDIIRRRSSPNYNVLALAAGWDQRWLNVVGGRRSGVAIVGRILGKSPATAPVIDGIDPVATALAVDRSSRRREHD